jgi:hypothetical protein
MAAASGRLFGVGRSYRIFDAFRVAAGSGYTFVDPGEAARVIDRL